MEIDLDDVQGNILRGYRRHLVRHLILEVTDRKAARAFLATAADGGSPEVPGITPATDWEDSKPRDCFNIGITFEGLRALGLPSGQLASFPTEFRDGMTNRAMKLGDFGSSAPAHWPSPFDTPERVHVIASLHGDKEEHLDEVEAQVVRGFSVIGTRDGRGLGDHRVFFNYVNNISQPRFHGISDPINKGVDEPFDPFGTILLGYPTSMENLRFRVPSPDALGKNGTFNAFRILAQDVEGFEIYLSEAADVLMAHPDGDKLLPDGDEGRIGKGLDRHGALREIVAAQMCGRWRASGNPYESSPDTPFPDRKISRTNFDYGPQARCPAGAHMRRGNPRGGHIVQRIANYSRRLVRRGMSYGPDFDVASFDPTHRDGAERGLLGNFIGANLGAQFEAVMCDWLNLGLQDPNITGSNDPLLGANEPETSWFDLALKDGGSIRLRGFPRFVNTRGGAYTFLPSLTAIRYLSKLR